MKIAIIGHFCLDIFHQADGTEQRELGGIFHSVAAMANLASDRDTLFPVFGVGETEIEQVRSAVSVYNNVDTSGIFSFPGESNYVHYYHDNPNERSLNISQPIPLSHIKKYLKVDGIYIDMISGSDITVNTIDELRLDVREKNIPIHLDMHCLTVGINPDGTRFRRAMSDWRRWCFMIDSVQMNEEEAQGISMEKFDDVLLAKQMMPLMVKAFVITRAERGISLYQADHKHLVTKEFANEITATLVSVIGSGDIFGASFLYAFLKKKKYDEAAMFAQRAASVTTRYALAEKHRCLAELSKEL